jgi:hypothetical protein
LSRKTDQVLRKEMRWAAMADERAARGVLAGEPEEPRGSARDTVVACRVDGAQLEAIDLLVETGICGARSEAAAWLIDAGMRAEQPLLNELRATVKEIRRLREQAQARARGQVSTAGSGGAGGADS